MPPTSTHKNIIFVTGTDTGVGKTLVTAILLRRLMLDTPCRVMKPIETGCNFNEAGELIAQDGTLLAACTDGRQLMQEVTPYRFSPPVAPLVAAAKGGECINWDELLAVVRRNVASGELLIIEGAGGLLVPITTEKTFLDLVRELEARVVVVVGSRLGALNHALLTFEALRSNAAATLGYVLNEVHAPTDPTQKDALLTNRQTLRSLSERYGVPELGYFPYNDQLSHGLSFNDVQVLAGSRCGIEFGQNVKFRLNSHAGV